MLRIWGRRNSTNVKKALWAAEELGLRYESVEVGGPFGGLDAPAFLALNPNGMIPVVEDGATVVWESNAIVRYLAARYDGSTADPDGFSLYPADPAARSAGDRWMDWTLSLMPPFRAAFMNLVRLPPELRDSEAGSRGFAECARLLAIPDRALAQAPYLSGERFAMGDIPLGCLVWGWYRMPGEHPDLPHLKAWYERLLARPAYARIVVET